MDMITDMVDVRVEVLDAFKLVSVVDLKVLVFITTTEATTLSYKVDYKRTKQHVKVLVSNQNNHVSIRVQSTVLIFEIL